MTIPDSFKDIPLEGGFEARSARTSTTGAVL